MTRQKKIFRRVVAGILFLGISYATQSPSLIGMCVRVPGILIALYLFWEPWDLWFTHFVVNTLAVLQALLVFVFWRQGYYEPDFLWWTQLIFPGSVILLMIGQSIFQRISPRLPQQQVS